jgi:hypothetical protein
MTVSSQPNADTLPPGAIECVTKAKASVVSGRNKNPNNSQSRLGYELSKYPGPKNQTKANASRGNNTAKQPSKSGKASLRRTPRAGAAVTE